MDEPTRNQFKKDLKEGRSREDAGRRAGISNESAHYEADRIGNQEFSQSIKSIFGPSGSSSSTAEFPFGLIAFVILCFVVAQYFDSILRVVLFAGLLVLMLVSFFTTFKGEWNFVQVVWLTGGSGAFGAAIYGLRKGEQSGAVPSLFGLDFPLLATGAAPTDALVLGFCTAMLIFGLPFVHDRLFRWMSGLGLTQALRIYVACDSRLVLRLMALAVLLPLAAALAWALLIWPGGSWVLRVILGYGLLLVASALLWVWRVTSDPRMFGIYFGHVNKRIFRLAWEKYGRE